MSDDGNGDDDSVVMVKTSNVTNLLPDLGSSSSEEENSSDESDDDSNDAESAQGKVALPSIDSLFESVGKPSFLEEDKDAAFEKRVAEISASVMQRQTSGDSGADNPQVSIAERNEARALAEATAAAKEAAKRKKRSIAQSEKTNRRKNAGGMTPNAFLHPALMEAEKRAVEKVSSRGAKDSESAKDKVKRQRLRGQTLGGETTVWKSEEEMRLRQQFD